MVQIPKWEKLRNFFDIRVFKVNLTLYFPEVLLMGRANPARQFLKVQVHDNTIFGPCYLGIFPWKGSILQEWTTPIEAWEFPL